MISSILRYSGQLKLKKPSFIREDQFHIKEVKGKGAAGGAKVKKEPQDKKDNQSSQSSSAADSNHLKVEVKKEPQDKSPSGGGSKSTSSGRSSRPVSPANGVKHEPSPKRSSSAGSKSSTEDKTSRKDATVVKKENSSTGGTKRSSSTQGSRVRSGDGDADAKGGLSQIKVILNQGVNDTSSSADGSVKRRKTGGSSDQKLIEEKVSKTSGQKGRELFDLIVARNQNSNDDHHGVRNGYQHDLDQDGSKSSKSGSDPVKLGIKTSGGRDSAPSSPSAVNRNRTSDAKRKRVCN